VKKLSRGKEDEENGEEEEDEVWIILIFLY